MEELEAGEVEGAEGGKELDKGEELEEEEGEELDLKKKLKNAELKLERTRQQLESGLQMNRVDKMACSVLKEENMKMAEKTFCQREGNRRTRTEVVGYESCSD